MNQSVTFYTPIEKKDPKLHMVYGYASTEALDSQGEIVKSDAMKAAIVDYMKFANVREMHQPKAVGKTKQVTHDEKGTYIGVKVVDKDAWEKVEEGVYNGFSIGGRVNTLDGNEITSLSLSEISLVDRPANPEAVFDVWKRDFSTKERKSLAESGKALPDGSFPIVTEEDLHNAIRAYGRAGDKSAAKAHIVSRAKAMGMTDALPDGWVSSDSKKMQKDIWGADRLIDLACSLNYYIMNEKAEGEDSSDLEVALASIKSAAVDELGENEDYPQEMSEMFCYADKIVDLSKRNQATILTNTKNATEQIVENRGAEPTNMSQEVKANLTTSIDNKGAKTTIITNGSPQYVPQGQKTGADEPTTLVKAEGEPTDGGEEEEETTEGTEEANDVMKIVDQKIKEGKMPTESEVDEMLKAQELPINEKTRSIMKFELAGLIVKAVEAQMANQINADAAKKEAEKVLNDADVKNADTVSEKNQFRKVLELITKAEKQIKKDAENAYVADEQATPPDAPDSKQVDGNSAGSDELVSLQAVVALLSSKNMGGALTLDEIATLKNGTANPNTSERTSGEQMSKPPFDGNFVPGKQMADKPTDLVKIEGKLLTKISELEEQIKKLNETPMPIKVKTSYQVVEKMEKTEGKQEELQKAEKRADELHDLMLASPNNTTLHKEAGLLSAQIQRLRREANGQ